MITTTTRVASTFVTSYFQLGLVLQEFCYRLALMEIFWQCLGVLLKPAGAQGPPLQVS